MSDISKIKVSGVEYNVKDSAALRDAPSDGKTYGRKNGAWSEVQGGGYEPPIGGIPKTDLASDVQASLGKADTSVQPADLTNYAQKSELADKQDKALIVSITQSGATYSADKTNAEINAAWQAGREVIASLNGGSGKIPCTQADATSAYFSLMISGDSVEAGTISIVTSGGTQTVTMSMKALQPTTIADSAGYFTTDTVEGALAEIGGTLDGVETALHNINTILGGAL